MAPTSVGTVNATDKASVNQVVLHGKERSAGASGAADLVLDVLHVVAHGSPCLIDATISSYEAVPAAAALAGSATIRVL